MARVPRVVGLTQAAAEEALRNAELEVGPVTTANSPMVPDGSIISTDPAAGASADAGTKVRLEVSSGPASVSSLAYFGNRVGRVLKPHGTVSGIILLFVIVTTAFWSVAFVSANQIQSRLSALNINGRLLSVAYIAETADRWRASRGLTLIQLREIDRIQEQVGKAWQKSRSAEQEVELSSHRLSQAISDLVKALNAEGIAFNDDISNALEERAKNVTDITKTIKDQKITERLAPRLGEFTARVSELSKNKPIQERTSSDYTAAKKELATRIAQIGNDPQAPRPIFEGADDRLDPAVRSRIENAVLEYSGSREHAFPRVVFALASIPVESITLGLVISLGALGAALHLGFLYLKDEEIYWSSICFMPAFGAVTALVVFIFVKAGVLVLATAPDQSGQASVNPYFTGFVAIISGLLAEQALLALRSAGAKLFTTDLTLGQSPRRWARKTVVESLKKNFGGETVSDEKLKFIAQAIGLPDASIDLARDKVEGRIAATPEEQRVISAMCDLEVRDAFSDLPSAAATDVR